MRQPLFLCRDWWCAMYLNNKPNVCLTQVRSLTFVRACVRGGEGRVKEEGGCPDLFITSPPSIVARHVRLAFSVGVASNVRTRCHSSTTCQDPGRVDHGPSTQLASRGYAGRKESRKDHKNNQIINKSHVSTFTRHPLVVRCFVDTIIHVATL